MDKINELSAIFTEMVENDGTFAAQWKNIPLGHKAFALMKNELPLRVEGELTPIPHRSSQQDDVLYAERTARFSWK